MSSSPELMMTALEDALLLRLFIFRNLFFFQTTVVDFKELQRKDPTHLSGRRTCQGTECAAVVSSISREVV